MTLASQREPRSPLERYRVLLEINNAIILSLTQEALFRVAAAALAPVIPFERSAIYLYDAPKDTLRLYAREADHPSERFVVGHLELPLEGSHVGWVIKHRRALLRRDLATERTYPTEDVIYAEGVRSLVVVPLVARGAVIGTLNLAGLTPGRYSEADAEFLQEVAAQVSLAVENMKAYEAISALKARLERENVYLREEIEREHGVEEIAGSSAPLRETLRLVEQVAPTDATVLVQGETGTGKELIARALHDRSARRERALVKVNCAAIASGLVESELFGHVKGAFTGALSQRIGRFELAHRGTLFLDEIGELGPETQVKLLRVLQEGELEPVGSSRTVRVDVRVVAATNRDLEEAVAAGRFRADLYYRLNVFPIRVPPLRERSEDIAPLARYFLERSAARLGKRVTAIAPEAMARLQSYPWPGNVRELRNIIERAVVLAEGPVLELADDLPAAAPSPSAPAEDRVTLAALHRARIVEVLEQTGWTIEGPKGAARILGLHANTLRYRMKKLGIRRAAP